MEFNPNNPVVKLCLQGMNFEEQNKPEEADAVFLEAWNKADSDHEKFLTAYYVARRQTNAADKLSWTEKAMKFAKSLDDDSVKSAYPFLYTSMADGYQKLGEAEKAKEFYELAASFQHRPADKGPFYHGTKADLQIGDLLTSGKQSNYQSEIIMNHIYFTALPNGAGLAAALAKGDGPERVYIVEPLGSFENDPNVTDKKFPGNPTRSYRTAEPLKIIGELKEWNRLTPEQLQEWREKLAKNQGRIIN